MKRGGVFIGNKEIDNFWFIGIFFLGGKSEFNIGSIRDG